MDIKQEVKKFLDQNVWDGEDRSGATEDFTSYTPDTLQELGVDLVACLMDVLLVELRNELEKVI